MTLTFISNSFKVIVRILCQLFLFQSSLPAHIRTAPITASDLTSSGRQRWLDNEHRVSWAWSGTSLSLLAQVKPAVKQISYQSQEVFHPPLTSTGHQRVLSHQPFFHPLGTCSSELLITFKLLFDWRSWACGQVLSNGLIFSPPHGDISGPHMSLTLPSRWL